MEWPDIVDDVMRRRMPGLVENIIRSNAMWTRIEHSREAQLAFCRGYPVMEEAPDPRLDLVTDRIRELLAQWPQPPAHELARAALEAIDELEQDEW